MLIVGELLNTSRKAIAESVEQRNGEYIRDLAIKQVEAGAGYLDVNCSAGLDGELDSLKWVIEVVQAAVDVPLCIDTPNPVAMELGLSLTRKGKPLANSITGEAERYRAVLPLLLKHNATVVALCMDDRGIPETARDRLHIARDLVKKLTADGLAPDDIYLDPLVMPVSTGQQGPLAFFEAVQLIKKECEGVHLICGLSNVSFGLPRRKILNRVFMIQTSVLGMDAYILDPLDKTLMGDLCTSQLLLGQDPSCSRYLTAYRKGLLNI